MNSLYIIPARGGSKGIPHKNIKLLNGKPLIEYSIDIARQLTSDDNICVSTDDPEIIQVAESYGLKVPFVRPASLASDTATTNDVLVHAVNFYKEQGTMYDTVILLQPTSPLRSVEDINGAFESYTSDIDMVVGVKESGVTAVLRQENSQGFLEPVFTNSQELRRQDAKKLYEINGAVYVINANSLLDKGMGNFSRIRKFVMDDINSLDIDTLTDWNICEAILRVKQ